VAGLAAAFGSGAMTNTIADIEDANVILITGSNTTENHPVLSSVVKRAVTLKGTKLIVVDPRRILITRYAAKWLRQNLGTDVAWINGLMHVIIKEGLHDKQFVENRTEGFDELQKTVEKFSPDYVEKITGIPARELIEAARLYAKAECASILYCMGITQHTTGTDNVKSLANLAMLCGNLGIEGGGVNPLRGQNNVQGACDMGGLPDVYSGYQKVIDPLLRQSMAEAWNVAELPDQPGMQATQMIPAAHDGTLKALYVIGENPLVSDPDVNHAEKSLNNLDFLVVQDIFLTETARLADVVLPGVCFAEKDGTFANTERRVQRVRKAVEPPGQAWDDWKIICEIATRLGYAMAYDNSRQIMEEISKVTPSYAGLSYERIEHEGIHWPCPTPEHPGTPILHREQFTRGKGLFHAIDYIEPAEMVDDEYPLFLTTGRLLYQYHTGTMSMKTEGLNEIAPEAFVEISPQDARKF
jgi:predicted molibdopterin-dependent oxidoreductase YjgC